MASPDKSTTILDQRFRRIGILQDDDIEPTPYPDSIIRRCAFEMRGGEELYIFNLRDDLFCQNLKCYIEEDSTKKGK